jgi:hypothetical protein
MPHPPHPAGLDNSDYTWRRIQIMQLLVMQFSPPSSVVPIFYLAHSSQTPPVSPLMSETKFHIPYRTVDKIIILYNRILVISGSGREDKRFWTNW